MFKDLEIQFKIEMGKMKRMKKTKQIDIIIMCDNNLENIIGGSEESTKIIINGISKKYSIGVIQPGKIKNQTQEVVFFNLVDKNKLKQVIKNPFLFLRYIMETRQIIKLYNPKVIHTQAQLSFFIVALLKKFRLISKDSYLIHTERGLYTKYNTFIKYTFYFFMRELNTLVTTTEFNMKYWSEALDKRGYSLDYRIIENTAGELFEMYDESLNVNNEDKLTIGFAGRYCDWKNWPLAVEISEKLNAIIGNNLVVKMVVGCQDKKALKETRLMFDQLQKSFGCRFDGRINLSIEEMDKFYYGIDIFILTSKPNTESFGRTLVEAMSRKTVVLTTDAGGSVEVVGNPNNVYRSADECIKRILEFFKDKEKMNKEKEKNFRRVREVYSLKNNLSKHLDMYREIIQNIHVH